VTTARWIPGDGSALAQLSEAIRPHVLVRAIVPTRDREGRPLRSRALRETWEARTHDAWPLMHCTLPLIDTCHEGN
jgi:hypothetical protein